MNGLVQIPVHVITAASPDAVFRVRLEHGLRKDDLRRTVSIGGVQPISELVFSRNVSRIRDKSLGVN